jgi:hypothetical protein
MDMTWVSCGPKRLGEQHIFVPVRLIRANFELINGSFTFLCNLLRRVKLQLPAYKVSGAGKSALLSNSLRST